MAPAVKTTVLGFFLVLVGAVPGVAQAPAVDGRLLREGVDTFHVSFAGEVLGHGIISRSRVVTANRPQLLQVYTWSLGFGRRIVDSLFSDATSLQSIRQVRVVGDTTIEVTYRGDSAHVETRPASDSMARRSMALATGAYSSAALDALVAGLPLAENFEAQLRFYYAPPSDRGVEQIGVHVAASDVVRDRSGRDRDAWVVLAETTGGGTVYWIDKTTRSVLKFDTKEGAALLEFRR
jgi:hypothetical protein